ncbi:MAG: hypothetical protein KGL39_11675 [Patescibacteria group bacterium]|nr:hypothetical protein [Patescibacteria group bacterium]
MVDNNLPPGLTLGPPPDANSPKLPPGLTLGPPPAAPQDKPQDISLLKGLGEAAVSTAKSALGLPATIYGEVRHPIQSLALMGAGAKQIPQAEAEAAKGEYQSVKSDIGQVMSNPSYYQKALHGGRAVLTAAGAIPNALIGVPYAQGFGQVAAKETGGLVSPQDAAMLPMMAAAAGPTKIKPANEFQGAAQRLGMNFSGAKSPEDIAAEITRAGKAQADRSSSWIWDRAPEERTAEQIPATGQAASQLYNSRKKAETNLWNAQESMANAIPHDATPQIDALKKLREDTLNRADADTPDIKKSVAAIDRSLAELGAPVQAGQQIIERTRDVGGTTKTTTRDTQYPPLEAKSTKTVEPTTEVGGGKFTERTQQPMESAVSQADKTRTVTTSPYSVTTRIVKGKAALPPRAATAGDLVRANKALNEDTYAAADKGVMQDIRKIVSDPLTDLSKTNKQFGKARSMALQQTQRNADIYKTDANVAKLGFDKETQTELNNAQRYGRMVGTDTLEKIANGVDKVDSPQKLLAARRTLPKEMFNMFLRAKNAALRAEAGMDYDKLVAAKPMLEEIYRLSRVPPAKAAQEINDLLTVAKEMKRYKIPSEPEVTPKGLVGTDKINAIGKVLSMAQMYSNPARKMAGQVALKMLPETSAEGRNLKLFRKAAVPKSQRDLVGPAVGMALGANTGNSNQ